MKIHKKSLAAICAALTMSGFSSLAASAFDGTADAGRAVLCDAAYEMLLDQGYTPAELNEMLSLTNIENIKDFAYSVRCFSAPESTASIKVDVTFKTTNVSFFGIVNGTITSNSISGNNETEHTQDTFSSTGKIMTYYFSRSNLSASLSNCITTRGSITEFKIGGQNRIDDVDDYVSIDDYSEFIALGDVNNDGSVDITDYVLICNFLVQAGPSDFDTDAADVNLDGNIDSTDATLVYYYIARINSHVWG